MPLLNPRQQRSDLDALVKESAAAFDRLTPDQQRGNRAAQRRSWVRGELMFEHPDMTADQANALIDAGL